MLSFLIKSDWIRKANAGYNNYVQRLQGIFFNQTVYMYTSTHEEPLIGTVRGILRESGVPHMFYYEVELEDGSFYYVNRDSVLEMMPFKNQRELLKDKDRRQVQRQHLTLVSS